ncbi:MAG: SURF1 family protein [Burkholderiales bacterium]|nr:SURF1 family protein [Burkholderiales bacterium]
MLGGRRFRPAFLPGVAALAAIALTLSLGNWQSSRAEEKLALGRNLDDAARRVQLALPPSPVDAHDYEFARVSARGEYSARHTVLLDNKVLRGVAGYQVLTPLKIVGGDMNVLVNRGWVAAGTRRDILPQISTPAGITAVEGIALVPGSHIFELGTTTEEGIVWQNLVLARYAKWSGLKLQPVVLQQTSAAADGLERVWARPDTGADKHRGYAFQWYALATTILIAYVAFSFKRTA